METRQSDLLAQKTQGNWLVSQKAQPRCSTEAGADTDTMLHVPGHSMNGLLWTLVQTSSFKWTEQRIYSFF